MVKKVASMLGVLIISLGLVVSTPGLAEAKSRTHWLDTKVRFYAESHRKPTTCVSGWVTAQGSAGRAQRIPGVKVLLQRKTKAGWRTIRTMKTDRRGDYGGCYKIGYGKRKDHYRVAVRSYTISPRYKGTRDVSRAGYFW